MTDGRIAGMTTKKFIEKHIIVFEQHNEVELPQEIVDRAPSKGAFDSYADWILENYDVQFKRHEALDYLLSVGIDDNSENLKDDDSMKKALLWLACLDCKENKTNIWYMGD